MRYKSSNIYEFLCLFRRFYADFTLFMGTDRSKCFFNLLPADQTIQAPVRIVYLRLASINQWKRADSLWIESTAIRHAFLAAFPTPDQIGIGVIDMV